MDAGATFEGTLDHQLDVRVLRFRSRPDSEEPALLALELVSAGRTHDALEVVDSALQADPDDVDLLLGCGVAAVRTGQLTFAQLVLTRAAKKAPEWAEPLRWLAMVLSMRGREERAADVARRALAAGATDDATRELVRRHERRVALDARLARFRDDPEHEEPALLAQALLDDEREAEALEVIASALGREEDADVLVVEARARTARREHARAEDALRRALALAPEWSEPARLLGTMLADRGALLEALPIVERALARNLDDGALVALLGRIEDQMRAAGISRPELADAHLDDLLSTLDRIDPIGDETRREIAPSEPVRKRSGWLPRIARRFFGMPEPTTPSTRPIARA
ncbi:tetratricopeptide repeat protein [Sandaracinus amylolyticus]|uniref:Tetratricopeptide repeat protein n=1 Tax=Sandaracinus amylolyticus TaxID=927083 RepID=A0A0F6SEH2_9BACT|nr:tetratricopeptide repeat protein [Sandaracinus amylolyticus]AKF05189.1 hypothetical protein DB32_002338 [Sandaracinus amylolyticus]